MAVKPKSTDDAEELAHHLHTFRVSCVAVCQKISGFTVNILGEDFAAYHTFFHGMGEYFHAVQYPVAECVRAMKEIYAFTLDDVSSRTVISDTDAAITDVKKMAAVLQADMDDLYDLAKQAMSVVKRSDEDHAIALVVGMCAKTFHYAWEMRAIQGKK
jgi:DNA-binding ferritin-like protein